MYNAGEGIVFVVAGEQGAGLGIKKVEIGLYTFKAAERFALAVLQRGGCCRSEVIKFQALFVKS